MGTTPATARREDQRLLLFLAVLGCAALGYTALAVDMDWRATSGLIGPGFVPRVIGVALVGCTVLAMVQVVARLRTGSSGSAQVESAAADEAEGPLRVPDHPYVLTTVLVVALMAGFVVFLQPLGAVLGSALFLLGALQVLSPGRWLTNVVIAVAVPVGAWLLLQTALHAGLPPGFLMMG